MAALSTTAQDAIRRLVDDLVRGDYAAIEADGRSGRLSQEELRRAVADYGRTLVQLPPSGIELADIHPNEVAAGQVGVDLPLWTVEEGRSDLTLSMTINERPYGTSVSIDDLHVL